MGEFLSTIPIKLPEMLDLGGNAAAGLGVGASSPGLLNQLFSNKLLMQMLAAGGADIAGATGGKNTLAAITQNIASGNYSKMLSSILGGGIPGAKMTADAAGVKLTLPNQQAGATPAGSTPAAPAAPAQQAAPAVGLPSLENLNPFASSQLNFSASDLAGVDPSLITQALSLKLQGDQFAQQRISDAVDAEYKQGMIQYYKDLARISTDQNEIDRLNALTNFLEAATKDQRTSLQKEFAEAKEAGFEGEIWDFKAHSETGDWRNYIRAKNQALESGKKTFPSFEEWLTKHERTRATQVNVGERALERAKVEPRVQLKDPKLLSGMIEDAMKNKWMPGASSREKQIARAQTAAGIIEGMIAQGQGEILDVEIKDGRMIWLVRWPNGDKEEIPYAINE